MRSQAGARDKGHRPKWRLRVGCGGAGPEREINASGATCQSNLPEVSPVVRVTETEQDESPGVVSSWENDGIQETDGSDGHTMPLNATQLSIPHPLSCAVFP